MFPLNISDITRTRILYNYVQIFYAIRSFFYRTLEIFERHLI